MDIISQFVSRYRREYDFYEQACRMVSQILDTSLQSAGIRAIVTSRAKNPSRLEAKIRQRSAKKSYAIIDDIYEDIVDLAGVRVALYFPAERDDVGRIIRGLFGLVSAPKDFPTSAQPSGTQPSYEKRFSGYWATHYRVRIPESTLNDSQRRYAEAKVEIQVASVLMHAWSEVEHDLVYKPLAGKLSEDEYKILDELNGLVLAGEIALERLQVAGERRVSESDREYTNHYDLASSLLETAREKLSDVNLHEAVVGRVDLLFDLLKELDLNTPKSLAKYVSPLHADFEKRPLAEQVIDQVLSEDPDRYSTFEHIRTFEIPFSTKSGMSDRVTQSEAIGEFMSQWIDYEKMMRTYAKSKGLQVFSVPSVRILREVKEIPPDILETADRLRMFRNQLVHGIEVPESDFIRSQAGELRFLTSRLRPILAPKKKPIVRTVAIKSKRKP